MSAVAPLSHIMSVDVEDYFQVEAFTAHVRKSEWERYPLRVNENTRRILDLFDEAGIKATFFFVGWVADKFPALVKETAARGHELACHSYWHRLVYSLDPEEFRSDTRRAKDVIEQSSGTRVCGYRAPSWSITRQSLMGPRYPCRGGFHLRFQHLSDSPRYLWCAWRKKVPLPAYVRRQEDASGVPACNN